MQIILGVVVLFILVGAASWLYSSQISGPANARATQQAANALATQEMANATAIQLAVNSATDQAIKQLQIDQASFTCQHDSIGNMISQEK